jgi:hypothetical protein
MARTKVALLPITGADFLYGFYTSLDNAERTALGHILAATSENRTILYGVNSPKPGRMRRVRESGRSATSFVAPNRVAPAMAAGWKLVRPARFKRPANSPLSKMVYVKYKPGGGDTTVNYAWRMPTSTYDAIGAERAALGIRDVGTAGNATARELVWGCNNPKPPRATKDTGTRLLSTFFDPDVTPPAGWSTLAAYGIE